MGTTGQPLCVIGFIAAMLAVAHAEPDTVLRSVAGSMTCGHYRAAAAALTPYLAQHADSIEGRLLAYELASITGDRPARQRQVDYFFDYYQSGQADSNAVALTTVARVTSEADPEGAFQLLMEAQALQPDHLEAYRYAATLCLDRYAWDLAEEQFSTMIKRWPDEAFAYAGRARLLLARGRLADAEAAADDAMARQADSVDASLVKVALLHQREDYAAARTILDRVLSVNSNDTAALSLLAVHGQLTRDSPARDAAIARVHAINSHHAGVFAALAEAEGRRTRYHSAVMWGDRARACDPQEWQGAFYSGMNLVRLGEEQAGYALLDTAFNRNGFNLWAYNMLTALEHGRDETQTTRRETTHFSVQLPLDNADALWPYLSTALEEMYAHYTRKYKIVPVGPKAYGDKLLVVLLASHDMFSARTAGLPGMAASGACFGQVVTMPFSDTVTRQLPHYNWCAIMRHEFLHVLTMQKTNYRVPRWLTEGISTMEGKDPMLSMDRPFLDYVGTQGWPTFETIDTMFRFPTSPKIFQLGYYLSEKACQYLSGAFGDASVLRLLDAYASGADDAAALPAATGQDMATLNAGLRTYLQTHAHTIGYRDEVDDNGTGTNECALAEALHAARKAYRDKDYAEAHATLQALGAEAPANDDISYLMGMTLQAMDKPMKAEAIWRVIVARNPRYTQRGETPLRHLADSLAKTDRRNEMLAVLVQWHRVDPNSREACVRLGDALKARKQFKAAAKAYRAAIYISPFKPETRQALASVLASGTSSPEQE